TTCDSYHIRFMAQNSMHEDGVEGYMYLEHWGLNDFPFENVPNPRYYFESSALQTLCEDLSDAIVRRKGAIVLTGDIGCGKSTVTQRILLNLPENRFDVALITYSMLSPTEMLYEVGQQLGLDLPQQQDKNSILKALQNHLTKNAETGRGTLICIDEAQSIPSIDTFEELRLLLNFQLGSSFLVSLLLVGQPELQNKIAALPQLKQRIALNLNLTHFDPETTMHYILHRLRAAGCIRPILTRQAIAAIHRHTEGVPRRINHLLDRCLLVGKRESNSLLDSRLVAMTIQRYPS
ncbi:MAG: AAA family ATPase, partial [Mariprofundaceae bacterium]|nr:AAA family ATPase [Mariprofundaceae bacterium]